MNKIKVLFVCHENICRSPMAEFILKDIVKKYNIENEFEIDSCATNRKKIGEDMLTSVKLVLKAHHIDYDERYARHLSMEDYDYYNYIIYMDDIDLKNIECITGMDIKNKLYKILSFIGVDRDIPDPRYSNSFNEVFNDIKVSLYGFIDYLREKNSISKTTKILQ